MRVLGAKKLVTCSPVRHKSRLAIILDGHIAIMIKFRVKKFLLQNMVEMEILLVVVTNIKIQLLDSLDIGHLMT